MSLPELTRRLTEANERIAEFPESVKVRGLEKLCHKPRSSTSTAIACIYDSRTQELGVLGYTFNRSTWETEVGGSLLGSGTVRATKARQKDYLEKKGKIRL